MLTGDVSGGGGGSGLFGLSQPSAAITAQNSETRPELEKVANDSVVEAAIQKAWNARNPNGPGKKQEKGFWIMRDDKTGALSVTHFPDNGTNDTLTPGPVPIQPGTTVVAFFHTHPNTGAEGYESGPSPADRKFCQGTWCCWNH
jgi:hypothetical protein